MKMKKLTISVLLFAAILAPLAVAADGDFEPRGPRGRQGNCDFQGRPGGFGGGPGKGFMGQGGMGQFLLGRIGNKLDLTEEQRAEIKIIMAECKDDREATQDTVREAMKALHEAAETGEEEAVADAAKTLADAFAQKALMMAETKKDIQAVLTDEQTAQLEELKSEMKERMQQRKESDQFGPRGGRRGKGGPRHGRRQGYGGGQRPLLEQD